VKAKLSLDHVVERHVFAVGNAIQDIRQPDMIDSQRQLRVIASRRDKGVMEILGGIKFTIPVIEWNVQGFDHAAIEEFGPDVFDRNLALGVSF